MSREDLEEYIREQMEGPTEITADDLAPPVCVWCGDELVGEIVTWDIPEHENESVVYRYRFCSEECKRADERAIINGDEMHPHGQPEVLTEDEREKYE